MFLKPLSLSFKADFLQNCCDIYSYWGGNRWTRVSTMFFFRRSYRVFKSENSAGVISSDIYFLLYMLPYQLIYLLKDMLQQNSRCQCVISIADCGGHFCKIFSPVQHTALHRSFRCDDSKTCTLFWPFRQIMNRPLYSLCRGGGIIPVEAIKRS